MKSKITFKQTEKIVQKYNENNITRTEYVKIINFSDYYADLIK